MAKKEEPVKIEGAIILTPQLANRIVSLFGEMPRKFSNLIEPVIMELQQAPIADVTLNNPKEEEKPPEK